ncbi:hypothetical protein ACIBI9_31220 [Nonomuraea sp. NPDC050451]|uniref:hypothetical protein n=1 Tax=Nonomuraea sp. NPDC050451 TaxID=3364364 RepID=UPI0037993D38
MNPAVKELWLTALRSEKYSQGRSALKITSPAGETKHCCLGVLCEIAVAVGLVSEIEKRNPMALVCTCDACKPPKEYWSEYSYGTDERDIIYPPNKVLEWAGMSFEKAQRLARMNDNGKPFALIADEIEESY